MNVLYRNEYFKTSFDQIFFKSLATEIFKIFSAHFVTNLIPILLKLYTCCDHAFEDMHISFKVDIFLMKINILVTDFIKDPQKC